MDFILVQSVDVLLDHGVQMLVSTFGYETRAEHAEITIGIRVVIVAQNALHLGIDEKERVEPEVTEFLLGRG